MTTNTPDTNYAALSDADLTRAVAERRGWTELEATTYWREDEHDTYKAELWLGTPPEGRDELFVPDYATDPAAALPLLREMNNSNVGYGAFSLTPYGDDWEVRSMIYEAYDWDERQWAVDQKPARAICLAWLAWKVEAG